MARERNRGGLASAALVGGSVASIMEATNIPLQPNPGRHGPSAIRQVTHATCRPDPAFEEHHLTGTTTSFDQQQAINTIRTLSIDGVQQANSGHPGAPMGAAPMAYVLWTQVMQHAPTRPDWFDRDRFVLSAGHASMLLYSMLHLTGYDLPLDELKRFRQMGSRTPGHPEFGMTAGVEATTGPLGQGFANAVGMAMAERRLAAEFNRPAHEIIDHHSYVICSDGDLQEGIAAEAASLAGHLKLGKPIVLYDDNDLQLDGPTSPAGSASSRGPPTSPTCRWVRRPCSPVTVRAWP